MLVSIVFHLQIRVSRIPCRTREISYEAHIVEAVNHLQSERGLVEGPLVETLAVALDVL